MEFKKEERMLKIIHSADWHYNDRDHDEIEKCVDFMIGKAVAEKPDLFVVSGDITDSQNLKLDSRSAKTICRQFSEMADIAPVVNIIGTPSHDGKSAEILRYVKGRFPIHVSEKPEQLLLQAGRLRRVGSGISDDPIDAVITQIPTPTKQFFQADSDIEAGDKAISDAMTALLGAFGATAQRFKRPHIVNGHFQVGGAFISETQQLIGRDIEISADQLAMAEADVICMGHIHKAQQIRDNIFYSGSIHRKTFGETEAKGFYVHEFLLGDFIPYELKSTFHLTPTRQKLTLREDFTKEDISTADGFVCDIIFNTREEKLKDAYVKVEFKIWQDEAGQINQAEIERSFLGAGVARVDINLIRIPRETVRAARVLTMDRLRDKISEMAALRQDTVSDFILEKADMLESMSQDELVQVVGSVN
jgi:DNA repair exonuclease SbcCD nuclease subunit